MNNRVALVTGAARGIGAAIAHRLADDGHHVAVTDLDVDAAQHVAETINHQGGHAVGLSLNVTDEDGVDTGVNEVRTRLGPISVLVNNAGITRDDLLFRMSTDDWDSIMEVHLRGAFLLARRTHADMREAGFGRIINLSSTSALGNRGQANYATAKAGLQGLTKTLALELGPFGITTNAVAPGFIVTDMTRQTAERIGQPFDEFAAEKAKSIPVRRGGTPEDIAHVVSFFADERSGFINGQVVYAAGGPRT